jgi:hypothetical protein
MPNKLLKIALITAGLFAALPAQAAGFSAAFGPLRMLAVTTTGSIGGTSGAESFCIGFTDFGRGDLALYAAADAPSWDI